MLWPYWCYRHNGVDWGEFLLGIRRTAVSLCSWWFVRGVPPMVARLIVLGVLFGVPPLGRGTVCLAVVVF